MIVSSGRSAISMPTIISEITEFCKRFYPNLIESDTSVLGDRTIDILIPEVNFGIIYAGLYTHSDLKGKDCRYFSKLTSDANEKNIRIIHIYEDEWRDKRKIIESIICARINKVKYKIYARKCEIANVHKDIAKEFMFQNHIQKYNPATNFGLYYENELLCVLSMGKSRFNKKIEWEIVRFCSKINYQVVGGFSKLYKFFVDQYNPNTVMTYADAKFGEGKVYSGCGFTFTHKADSNYFYIVDGYRLSRQKYQKHNLITLLETFDPNITEWQNMVANGYDRIWDCGNYVFTWAKPQIAEE